MQESCIILTPPRDSRSLVGRVLVAFSLGRSQRGLKLPCAGNLGLSSEGGKEGSPACI